MAELDVLDYLDAHAARVRVADDFSALDVIVSAVIVQHTRGVAADPEDVARAADIMRTARRAKLGPVVLPEIEDDEELLQTIYDLGFLVDVLSGEARARLVEALDMQATKVLLDPTRFAALHDRATLLSTVIELPAGHPVQDFIDTIANVTDPDARPFTDAELAHGLAAIDRLAPSPWARWRQRLLHLGDTVAAFFSPQPVLALADTGRVRWPAPRLLLAQNEHDEVGLVVVGDALLVELLSARPWQCTLEVAAGPLVDARYWLLPADVDAIELTDGDTWSIPITPLPTATINTPRRLAWWQQVAPGSLRARLITHSVHASRALAADARQQAARVTLDAHVPLIGRVWFPVPLVAAEAPGALVTLDAHRLGGQALDTTPIAAWIARLVAAPDHPRLASLTLSWQPLPDVHIVGESYQLAAAVAALSHLLGRAPPALVASGRLGLSPGEVLPIEAVDLKRRIAFDEAPDAQAVIIDAPTDFRATLATLFGVDWLAHLRARLELDSADQARLALRAWRRFFAGRSALDLGALRDSALAHAEGALAAIDPADPAFLQARWVRAAMWLHQGDTQRALPELTATRAALAAAPGPWFEAHVAEECEAYIGIALIDTGRPLAAVALLSAAHARLVVEPLRDRRWHTVMVQVAGSLARALGFLGRLDEAIAVQGAALALAPHAERARCGGDLAELERRAGRPSSSTLADAHAALDEIDDPDTRALTERFLTIYAARLGRGSFMLDPPIWSEWPQPLEALEAARASSDMLRAHWFARLRPTLGTLGTAWLIVLAGRLAYAPELQAEVLNVLRTRDVDAHVHDLAGPEWERCAPY